MSARSTSGRTGRSSTGSRADIIARPRETPGIPNHVHWYEFLDPAPDRPYHPVYHPHNWRVVGLRHRVARRHGLSHREPRLHGLKLGLPTSVSARSGEINSETYPAWATITYEFPARGDLPPVKLTWNEGARNGKRNLPSADLFPAGFQPSDSGSLFIGSKGKLYSPSDYGSEQVLARGPVQGFQGPRADPAPDQGWA